MSPAPAAPKDSSAKDPGPSSLIICRNKHWRYISSFHGPWLQIPPEVLLSLANGNYALPQPRPIDPAVFYDLVKIRFAVDEATDLAVRATSGVASSSLTNALGGNGMRGGGGGASFGFGLSGGGGSGAKLSRERKHRMREMATQKLAKAYRLDEIATSVATMQSASTLEDVASMVLPRNPTDNEAKYVHFFHEKIPSRRMAECTSLKPLDEVIAADPGSGQPLRTRAITRIFKEDHVGAVKDLTEALGHCRLKQGQHKDRRRQLASSGKTLGSHPQVGQRQGWSEEFKVDEADQPSSLENQLLFQRAAAYLTIACGYISQSLPPRTAHGRADKGSPSSVPNGENAASNGSTESDAEPRRVEARKVVKTNAKRALKDLLMFLSHFDHSPGVYPEIDESKALRSLNISGDEAQAPLSIESAPPESPSNAVPEQHVSRAMVSHESSPLDRTSSRATLNRPSHLPVMYPVSALFSSSPPSDLPPFPCNDLIVSSQIPSSNLTEPIPSPEVSDEGVTYHPLLTDVLHSLLLCHCLIQTSTKELQRHAYMVARLARICDGYPIFLAARSPSRADWIEVLRRAGNWLDLQQSWEALCNPAPLPGYEDEGPVHAKEEQTKQTTRNQGALTNKEEFRGDDIITTDQPQAQQIGPRDTYGPQASAASKNTPKRWAQDQGKEYPISTDRAEAIARWITEVPVVGSVDGGGGGAAGGGGGARKAGGLRKKKTKAKTTSPGGQVSAMPGSLNTATGTGIAAHDTGVENGNSV